MQAQATDTARCNSLTDCRPLESIYPLLEPVKKRRSKSGCLPCRFRHKKCGEQKPKCEGCIRNHILCSWPSSEMKPKPKSPTTKPLCRSDASPGPRMMMVRRPSAVDSNESLLPSKYYNAGNHTQPHLDPLIGRRGTMLEPWLTFTIPRPLSQWPVLRWNPLAQQLLQFYIEATSARLTVFTNFPNPLLNVLLPLACQSDDLIHAICAISSSHRSVEDEHYSPTSRTHYAVALRAAKYHVTEVVQGSQDRNITLLTLLILLSHFEGVDGNMQGSISSHLMAARIILTQIGPFFAKQNPEMASFLLEQYSYLEIVSANTGFDIARIERNQALIHFLNSALCSQMLTSPSFGFLFGESFSLLKLIPEVADFAFWRSATEPRCDDSIALQEFFRLESLILTWRPYPQITCEKLPVNGLIYQQALLVDLRIALNGPGRPTPSLMAEIDKIVKEFIQLLKRCPSQSPLWANLMWPIITVGSCMDKFEDQRFVYTALENLQNSMLISRRILQLLDWLWEENKNDSDAYGPFGITHVSKQHGVELSMG